MGLPCNPNEETSDTGPSHGRFDAAPVFIMLLGDWRARVGLPDAAQSSDARVENLFRTSLAGAFLFMYARGDEPWIGFTMVFCRLR